MTEATTTPSEPTDRLLEAIATYEKACKGHRATEAAQKAEELFALAARVRWLRKQEADAAKYGPAMVLCPACATTIGHAEATVDELGLVWHRACKPSGAAPSSRPSRRVVLLFVDGDFIDAWAWPSLVEARAFARGVAMDLDDDEREVAPGQLGSRSFVLPDEEGDLAGAGFDDDELAEARRTAALRFSEPSPG